MEDKKIMRDFVTFYFQVKQSTFKKKEKKKKKVVLILSHSS